MWIIFIVLTILVSLGPSGILRILSIPRQSLAMEVFIYLLLYVLVFLFTLWVLRRR